jgi:hypothetical protein
MLVLLWFYRDAARNNGLRADSLMAAGDTLRHDGQTWLLRAMQLERERDSLDRALKHEPAAQVVTVVRVDSFVVVDSVPVAADPGDSVRSASWERRSAPWTASVTASLPRAPGLARLGLSVALDSIPLDVRIGCGPKTGGIRSAEVAVTGPTWARVGLSQVSVTPDACNPKSSFLPAKSVPTWFAGLAALLGFVVGVAQ